MDWFLDDRDLRHERVKLLVFDPLTLLYRKHKSLNPICLELVRKSVK